MLRSAAPSARPRRGLDGDRSSGAAGVVKLPLLSNVRFPLAIEVCVPAVPPVKSSPGMVTS